MELENKEPIMPYSDFRTTFNAVMNEDRVESIRKFIEYAIKNPHEIIGADNLSTTEDTYIGRMRQSQEIKYGNAIEDALTLYIGLMGYKNLDKKIGKGPDGKELYADQVFMDEKKKIVYLIEQKKKDNHDSTKKRGQMINFKEKTKRLVKKYPGYKIVACMWFLNTYVKNKKFYLEEMAKNKNKRISMHLFYGEELFTKLFKRPDVWYEFLTYLRKVKKERSNTKITMPNFDTSPKALKALKQLKENKPGAYKKLMSDKPEYILLRAELFPTGQNLAKVAKS